MKKKKESIKIREWFWESLRVEPDAEQSNRKLKFRYKSIINSYKNKVKTISKFSLFIRYVLGLFALNTKIEGITKIWSIISITWQTNFVFNKRILKLWSEWVETSNNIVYKWRKFEIRSLNFIFAPIYNTFALKFQLSIWLFHVWPHSQTFPKSFSYFYWFLSENLKRNYS